MSFLVMELVFGGYVAVQVSFVGESFLAVHADHCRLGLEGGFFGV